MCHSRVQIIGERLGLWITVAGILLLGLVSCFYTGLLDMTAADGFLNMYFIG